MLGFLLQVHSARHVDPLIDLLIFLMRLLVYPTQLILLWYRLPEATVLQMIKGVLSASLTFSGNMTEAHHNWSLKWK